MKILVDQHFLHEIPLIEFYQPEPEHRLPVVLILHGFSGRKEHCFTQAYQLAQLGFFAVSIDLHLHGEASEGEFNPAHVAPRLREVITHSVGSIVKLVDTYAHHPIADGNQIGILGISLGGAVLYSYLPHRHVQVRAAVAQIAGAAAFWQTTMRSVMIHFPEFGVTEEMITLTSQTASDDPFLPGVVDFPLLLQYGQADPIVPIAEIRRLYNQVRTGYTRTELISLVEYAHTGHETPPIMFESARKWFEKHLKSLKES
jgi:uncharacterized protein